MLIDDFVFERLNVRQRLVEVENFLANGKKKRGIRFKNDRREKRKGMREKAGGWKFKARRIKKR